MTELVLPPQLKQYAGRIIDVDTHEMMPAQQWGREFGPLVRELEEAFTSKGETFRDNPNHPNIPEFTGDDRAIDATTIWSEKGSWAPGACDPKRRLDVMDAMGVERQLMFPTGVGMFGLCLMLYPRNYGFLANVSGDRYAKGKAWVNAYNEWGIRAAHVSDRIRPVLPLIAESVDGLMSEARRLIDNGIRAIWLPGSVPPGGKSPAHPDLDPFWNMLVDAKVVASLHLGGEMQFFETVEWRNAPAFEHFRDIGEFRVDPWSLSTNHWPIANFLGTMTVGGVFERHPGLHFAVIEAGTMWVGPLLEHLDVWHDNSNSFGTAYSTRLPKRPSEYIRRNVRVSPFFFEPIDRYIEMYGLEDMICFATDYPHIEGGKLPATKFYNRLERLGTEVIEKFFIRNGKWLFPD